jgi:spermidine/putrescine ABC transporter ATP-binding subunit
MSDNYKENKSPSPPVVELRNVTKRFGNVVAVDDISLKIEHGEFFSLLGPSGCGKTTTLRMIGGFSQPELGEVYLNGNRVTDVPANKRDTNMVFQQLGLFPHLDVFDNIAFGLTLKKIAKPEIKEQVLKMLDLVELNGLEERRIHQLSGGQQQRVAIARALINEPAVLLLDEPLGALDLKLRLQMQFELKSIQKRVGTSFIYVTHDQSEALTMSDRIAVMRDGLIEQVGSAEEIYSRSATRFVATFIGETNLIPGQVMGQENGVLVIDCDGLKVLVASSDIKASGPVSLSLRPEKVKIASQLSAAQLDNEFPGRVASMNFMGSKLYYEVVLENGLQIKIETLHDDERSWHPGDQVVISWSNLACVVLKDE